MQTTNVQNVETLLSFDTVGGLSNLRATPSLNSGGSIAASGSEVILSTGTTNGSVAQITSLRRASGTPGSDILTQIGLRTLPAAPTGAQVALWGLYDDNEGYGFGRDATNFFTFVKTGGVLTKTYRTNWSIDRLDRSGPSTLAMPSPTDGIIFQMRSMWYGGVEYGLFRPEGGAEQINIHHTNSQEPMYLSPYLPLRAEVQNNTTTGTNFQLLLSLGKVSQVTNGRASSRLVSQDNLNLACPNGTDTPFVSLTKVTGSTIPVSLDSIEIITDQPLVINGVFGGDVTQPNWTNPSGVPNGESVCQVDTAHGQSPFNVVYKTIVPTGLTVHKFDTVLPYPADSSPITFTARPIGATDATASFNLRWREQW